MNIALPLSLVYAVIAVVCALQFVRDPTRRYSLLCAVGFAGLSIVSLIAGGSR